MNKIASKIAGIKPTKIELEVYYEDEVETTYTAVASIWWQDKEIEFYDFKNKDTGEEIDEDTFWKMFDRRDLEVKALEKAETSGENQGEAEAAYGDYLYDQEKDRKMMEKP